MGILKKQDRALDTKQILGRMCQIMKHEGWYKIDTFLDTSIGMGRVSLGILSPGPQPIFNEDKSLCIMMEGEIYDYRDLKEELISKGHKFSVNNDPELILHLYEEYGKEFVYRLNGSFVLAIWDSKKQELLIVNDRHGLRPLYYTEHNGYLLFGSEVKAILEDKTFEKVVNERAVADFFSFGHMLGSKTFFKGIELLPPASIMRCNKDQVSVEKYWAFNFNEEYEQHPEEYYVDRLSKLILQAVDWRMKGKHKIGVALSGGLDSRTIVASIDKKYYPIHTYTFGESLNCDDVRIAQIIADEFGMSHHYLKIGPEYLIDYAKKAVWLTDGMLNVIHSHGISVLHQIKSNSQVCLGGMNGDSLFENDLGKEFLDQPADDKFISTVFARRSLLNESKRRKLFSGIFYDKIRDIAFQSLKECLMESEANFALNKYAYLRFENERRFILLGPKIVRSQVEYRLPFYDNELIDFMLSVPPKSKINRSLHRRALLKIAPNIVGVPWQKTGLPIGTSKIIERIYDLHRGGKSKVNKLLQKIRISPLFKNNRNYADYDSWMRNNIELRKYIHNIVLDKKALSRRYFNPDYIRKIIHDHMSEKENNAQIIGLLLTFELFNRMFIDGDKLQRSKL